MVPNIRSMLAVGVLFVLTALPARIASQAAAVTSPVQQFGASIGDDYFLVTYPQLETYWKKLDAESARMQLVDIGRTEEGRTQWMAAVSSPENLAQLDRYREISRRLALAEGLDDEAARTLAQEGRAIVWIDGGQHASEVLGAQQLIELVYQLVSGTDEETERVLRDVIVLAAHANPDGHALVADWYMREPDPRRRTLSGLPRLYQKYVGHDNNRDFFLSSQAETININRVLYHDWFPQIVYDHHQAAPAGTVMFAPPFSGPYSPFVDPLVPAGVELLGEAIHARFAAEGKRGVTTRGGGNYSAWWNGGLRTTAYFHNQIGLLTETIGSPAPIEIPSVPSRQQASADLPYPIAPRVWRFRESVEYSMTANRAVLDVASRMRETLLFNAYRMARNSIERGGDAYVVPADQPDFLTATKFIDALMKAGVAVHRASAPFEARGRIYPSGSYIVETAQAFRPHILDMFEPQTPPEGEPYDITGWTLAFQMGVKFDRIADIDGPLERVTAAVPPRGIISGPAHPAGYFVSHHQNDAAVVVNRLLGADEDVYWLLDRSVGGHQGGTGVIYIAAREGTLPILREAAAELGLSFTGVNAKPAAAAMKLRQPRVGLWDRNGGTITSGWIRWLLERYEFPFTLVHAQDLEAEGLRSRYDVLIVPDEAAAPGSLTVPLPRVREFVNAGGTLMLIGDSTVIAGSLGVEVKNAIAAPRETFFIPGSILRVSVDNTQPLGYGFEREVDVFFDRSPVFTLNTSASQNGPRPVAWFSSASPLRSGWARGQEQLDGHAAVVDAPLGRGRILLFGPDVTFRAQSHATFKFLFNGILYATAG